MDTRGSARVSIVGRTYLERGEPVKVLAQWMGHGKVERWMGATPAREGGGDFFADDGWWTDGESVVAVAGPSSVRLSLCLTRSGPRNVLIERADGSLVVRPFRGLRKPKEEA